MSDEENTEAKPQADGRDCPAAQPLCLCGVRGCAQADTHAKTLRTSTRRRRRVLGRD